MLELSYPNFKKYTEDFNQKKLKKSVKIELDKICYEKRVIL